MTKRIVRFDCPYLKCQWPRCKDDIRHPSCASVMYQTRMEIAFSVDIAPRKKKKIKKL